MSPTHDPPDEYQFNKLRTVGGSLRLTLVKDAVSDAEIDVSPPRPLIAYIPTAEGVWMGFAVSRYDSQRERVRLRSIATDELDSEMRIVGEFPVHLLGKIGSAVTRVPAELVDALDLEVDDRITTIAVAPGLVLFATEGAIDDAASDLWGAISAVERAARE